MKRTVFLLVASALMVVVMFATAGSALAQGATVFTGPFGGHIVKTPSGNVNGHCAFDLCNFHF